MFNFELEISINFVSYTTLVYHIILIGKLAWETPPQKNDGTPINAHDC